MTTKNREDFFNVTLEPLNKEQFDVNIGLSYDDVLLIPREGQLEKREEADLITKVVPNVEIDIPILSAPMDSVTDGNMAMAMWKEGGFGVIHRNNTIEEQVKEFQKVVDPLNEITWTRTGCAIGISEGLERVKKLDSVGCRIFVLDVAHAHHKIVGDFIDSFNNLFNYSMVIQAELIVGNIATAEGARFLMEHGVNGIKVGVGPGAACKTREVTGFGYPQLSAIMEVVKERDKFAKEKGLNGYKHTVIADGGIKNSGDIVKALAAGADSVMIGKLLAGTKESPMPGKYWGMASQRVNGHRAAEGIEGEIGTLNTVEDVIKELSWGIRSGLSYGGATNLKELREKAKFVRIAPGVAIENATRL